MCHKRHLRRSIVFFSCIYLLGGSLFAQDASDNAGKAFPPATARASVLAHVSIGQVDSIARLNDFVSHFARVYIQSMHHILSEMKDFDSAAQEFILKFEKHFADYFLDAYYDHRQGTLPDSSEWKPFFYHSHRKPWQLILMGVNTHINIDLSQSLIHNFSAEEIKKYKRPMLVLQKAITKVYWPLFEEIQKDIRYLRWINTISFGLVKMAGERWLYKWRKRNIRLAIIYFDQPERFRRKLAQVSRKKDRIDRLILNESKFFL